MKLSFIIPFYNGGKYIIECLDSLYAQDVPQEEYEVIIVDDCSSNTDDIKQLEEYAVTHSTLRIIHNERNMRCGGSRNAGLLKANGDYIWFIDQDDYIAPNSLASMLKTCYDNSLDMLYFDFRDVSDDMSLNKKRGVITNESDVKSGLEYINDDCGGDFWDSYYDTNVWHALYRREFMIENQVFSPEVSYCEDMIVALHAIIVAQRFMAMSEDYYRYRCNPDSVFHTEVGVKGRPIFDASIYAGSEIVKMSQLVPSKYQDSKDTIKEGGVYRINSFTKSILKISSKQRKLFFRMVAKYTDVVESSRRYMTPVNKWIISHPKCVQCIPHLVYVYVKLFSKKGKC